MLDIWSCRDDTTKSTFKRRWASTDNKTDRGPMLERNEYYRIEAMELTCWKLFHLTVRLHTHGTRALGVYDDDALGKVTRANQRLEFGERIHAICDLLRLSKDRCNKLLKGEMLAMTVACPLGKVKEVKTNKRNNRYKQYLLQLGRNAEQRQEEEALEQERIAATGLNGDRKRQVDLADDADTVVEEDTARRKRRRNW